MAHQVQPYADAIPLHSDEIRVLTLFPGLLDTPISCRLSKVSSNTRSPYSALSYVWGDANHKKTIEVNGLDVCVTSSLEIALRHLRDETSTLEIWIDAKCINQNDVE